jgi:hypothetical protein
MKQKRKLKSYRAYSDANFLRKVDVETPQLWTITNVEERTVTAPGKEAKDKLVLFFDGNKKGLVCNIANGDVLFDMTGTDDPEEWIGIQVELYVDEDVPYAGKRVGGIRLRKPQVDQPQVDPF